MIMQSLSNTQLVVLALLSIPAFYVLRRTFNQEDIVAENPENQGVTITTTTEVVVSESSGANDSSVDVSTDSTEPESVMQAEKTDLAPPRDDPFTLEQLKEFDGSVPDKPIYVAIKRTVFDVSSKRQMYGPGGSYSVFAGRDGSRGLGMSSLKAEDAVSDYSQLPESELKVLDDWHSFFTKRYNIVGKVVDLPEAVEKS